MQPLIPSAQPLRPDFPGEALLHRPQDLSLEPFRKELTELARNELGHDLQAKGDPADLVQETFLDAFRDLEKFRGSTPKQLRFWLRGILRNNLRTFRRRYRDSAMRGVGREVSLVDFEGNDGLDQLADDDETPSGILLRNEVLEQVKSALHELPQAQRVALKLKTRRDLTFRELGDLLGCSGANAFKLCRDGLARIRCQIDCN